MFDKQVEKRSQIQKILAKQFKEHEELRKMNRVVLRHLLETTAQAIENSDKEAGLDLFEDAFLEHVAMAVGYGAVLGILHPDQVVPMFVDNNDPDKISQEELEELIGEIGRRVGLEVVH